MSAVVSPSEVYLAVESVDFRMGMDGLSLLVQQSLGKPPCDGSAYAFRSKAGNRIKLLVWDGTGVWLAVRRLHQGRFVWPRSTDSTFTVTQAEWEWLIAGVDWQRLRAEPLALWRV